MSVFDPSNFLEILRVSTPTGPKLVRDWKTATGNRLKSWLNTRPKTLQSDPLVTRQLEWESNVVEYVSYVFKETRHHASSKQTGPKILAKVIPILGPRFLPPTFLDSQKRDPTNIQPAVQYMRPLNVVHPFYFDNIGKCPQCSSNDIAWDSWTSGGSRNVHGVRLEEKAIGFQLRCKPCEGRYSKHGTNVGETTATGEKLGYSFATTNTKFWNDWQHWEIPRGVPHFNHRCALTRELFDLIVELRPSTTSGKIAENIKQLHLLEYKQRHMEYVTAFKARVTPRLNDSSPLESFSTPDNATGYNNKSITDDLITDIYLEFCHQTRIEECSRYLRTLKAICLNLDHTFAAANKATVVDDSKAHVKLMRGGVLSVLNECNEIISWRYCQTGSANEITELLAGVKLRLDLMGVPEPSMVTVDNCCHVRNFILGVFASIKVLLDVYHFIMRYGAVILNGANNPHRGEVLKDIRDAVIKVPANNDAPAQYWPQEEQKTRLAAAFDKWAIRGGVWSAAAHNVHAAQMQHVAKGCLARPRDDIASDGSRIEGSHKGWKGLQRAVASGLELQTALGHDFVLRRNLSVAFNGKIKSVDPFALSTFGSHHVGLVDHTAALWNDITATRPGLAPLPRLKDVKSGEKFGLVPSAHTDTFGGLYTIKPDPENEDDIIQELDPEEQQDLIDELHLDPALFLQPMDRLGPAEAATVQPGPKLTTKSTMFVDLTRTNVGSSTPGSSTNAKRKDHPAATSNIPTEGSHPSNKKKIRTTAPTAPFPIFLASGSSSSASDINTPSTPEPTMALTALNAPLREPTPQPAEAKLTRSQRLFAESTGIDPRALKIDSGAEFFLFMEMRKELQWRSFEMTPKRWAEATVVYNTRLQATPHAGRVIINKNPRALLDKLGQIEPRIIQRIADKDYKSAKGSTTFWTTHCNAVSFVKLEPGSDDSTLTEPAGKARKHQTCTRCLTIKYPGPPGSPVNHKKACCSDGFKPKLTDDVVAPWPLPTGIFSNGAHFHPLLFLAQVREIYDRLIIDRVKREDLSLEHDAFLKLLEARLVVDSGGNVLFKLFSAFTIPAEDKVPDDLTVVYNGAPHLFINSLRDTVLT
ncbi:hypothetical protein C8F04DRAFT_1328715 [Mycena alexandri]|uniref:Uncharacterized protein n=1 Tax=Mycena alexandri TaxID=1745969 RepID=A0AAD6T1Z9_9AGAR|nr:hypothetical protein C8F04DRAFT_1328715 [Mycena alexandri]